MSLLRSIAVHAHVVPGVERWLPSELRARATILLSQSPPVQELLLDGGLQSMKRSFTMGEYRDLFRQAGYPEGSLKCSHSEQWSLQDVLGTRCRIACRADLTAGSA